MTAVSGLLTELQSPGLSTCILYYISTTVLELNSLIDPDDVPSTVNSVKEVKLFTAGGYLWLFEQFCCSSILFRVFIIWSSEASHSQVKRNKCPLPCHFKMLVLTYRASRGQVSKYILDLLKNLCPSRTLEVFTSNAVGGTLNLLQNRFHWLLRIILRHFYLNRLCLLHFLNRSLYLWPVLLVLVNLLSLKHFVMFLSVKDAIKIVYLLTNLLIFLHTYFITTYLNYYLLIYLLTYFLTYLFIYLPSYLLTFLLLSYQLNYFFIYLLKFLPTYFLT